MYRWDVVGARSPHRRQDDKTTIANRIEAARLVLTEIMATPDQAIPNQIYEAGHLCERVSQR